MESRFEEAHDSFPVLVYEVPILFELGLDKLNWKAIVVIHVEDKIAITRLIKNRGFSKQEAEKRLSIQMPVSEKIAKADYEINNSGSKNTLKSKLEKLWKEL